MSLEQQISALVDSTNALTQAVTGKIASIDDAVEGKAKELDAWRVAARGEYARPFSRFVTVAGASNKYYPVMFPVVDEDFAQDLTISRYFGDPAPADLDTTNSKHVAALTLRMKLMGAASAAIILTSVEDYRFAYHASVASIWLGAQSRILFLRGGGMRYKVSSSHDVFDMNILGTQALTPMYEDNVTVFPQSPDQRRVLSPVSAVDTFWASNITVRTHV